jgi:hypothetical protein
MTAAFKPSTLYVIKDPSKLVSLSPSECSALQRIENLDEYINARQDLVDAYAQRYRFAVSASTPSVQGCQMAQCIVQDELGNPAPYNGDIGCVAAITGHFSSYTDIGIDKLEEVDA